MFVNLFMELATSTKFFPFGLKSLAMLITINIFGKIQNRSSFGDSFFYVQIFNFSECKKEKLKSMPGQIKSARSH